MPYRDPADKRAQRRRWSASHPERVAAYKARYRKSLKGVMSRTRSQDNRTLRNLEARLKEAS